MRSVCMNGQGWSLKAGPQKEIRTRFITWQLESLLHLLFMDAAVGERVASEDRCM